MRRSKRLLAGRVPCRCAEARAGPRYRILWFVETINARKRHNEASDKPHPHGPYRLTAAACHAVCSKLPESLLKRPSSTV